MTIMNSMQITQMMAMQQQAVQQQFAYSQGISSQMAMRSGGMMSGGGNASGNVGYATASTFMSGMQNAPRMAEYGMLAGGLAMGAAGMMPMSGGGAMMGAGLGGLLGGPGGAMMGAAYGALPAGLGLGIPALAYGGMYAASQMGQGYGEYGGVRSALGAFNFQNPSAATGRGFSSGQAGQITSMLRDVSLTTNTGMQELTGMVSQMPSMGLMQGVRDAQEFQRKFKDIVEGVKQMTTVLGSSMQEALPFFADLRRSGFYSAQDITGNAVQRQVLGTMGYSGPQFTQLQRTGASIAQAHGARRATGAGLATRLAGGLGTAVQEGIISEEAIMEATGGLTGAEAYNQLSSRFTQQAFNFSHTAVGRAMLLAMGETKEGRFTGGVDRGQVARLRAGDINVFGVRGEAGRRLGGKEGGSRVSFVANEELIRGSVMEQAGPELIESVVRDVAKGRGIAGAEDDIVTLLMKRFTNLNRAEAEVMVEMAQNAATIRQQQRERVVTEIDREINELGRQRSSVRGRMQEMGRMWGGAVTHPLREMGQGIGRGIESDVQRQMDRFTGQYQVNISESQRMEFKYGGTPGGDLGGVLGGSGGGSVGGLGGSKAFRRELGGNWAGTAGLSEEAFSGALSRENRRALGTLTAGDVGLSAGAVAGLGGRLEDLTLESRAFDRRVRTGQLDAGFLVNKFGGDMGIEGWGEMGQTQRRDVMRMAAAQMGQTLEGEEYAIGAGGYVSAQTRGRAVEDLAAMGGGGGFGTAALGMALRANPLTGLLNLAGRVSGPVMNIGQVAGGARDARSIAGMLPLIAQYQRGNPLGADSLASKVLGGKKAQAIRDLMAGEDSQKAANFLSQGNQGVQERKLLRLKKLKRRKDREKGKFSEADEKELQALQGEIGDLPEEQISALLKVVRNGSESEIRTLGSTIQNAGDWAALDEFASTAQRVGAGLQENISSAGASRAGVTDEGYREIEAYAKELSGLTAAEISEGHTPSTANLAERMRGMTQEQQSSMMGYLDTLGPAGEQMAASVRVRMNRGSRGLTGLSSSSQTGLIQEIGQRTGNVDLEAYMREMETTGKTSELYRALQRSTEEAGGKYRLDEDEAARLSTLIADALDNSIISGGTASGTKSGTVQGDVQQMALSIEKAMAANKNFVLAVGATVPELQKVTEETIKGLEAPAE